MRKIIISVTAIFAVGTVGAQELTKQLEVTREYNPQVEQADKLPVEPNVLTKSELQLSSPYKITSVARPTPFTPTHFEPVKIDGEESSVPQAIYIRLGAGLPLQTTADIYYTPKMPRGSTLGFFGNHRGQYSKYRNDLKINAQATEWLAGVGAFGSQEINRFVLVGDLTFDYRNYSLYGVSAMDARPYFAIPTESAINNFMAISTDQNRIGWTHIGGNASFGDTFTDLRHFNFKVTLNAGYTAEAKQGDVNLEAKFGQLFGRLDGARHGFEAGLWERSATVKGDNGSALTLGFEPRYVLEVGRFQLRAGADIYWLENKTWAQSRADFFGPAFDVRGVFADGKLEPFLYFESQMIDGSLGALVRRNPYAEGNAPTGISGDLRIGAQGVKRGVFSYKISGGVSFLDNYHVFVARQKITLRQDLNSTDYSAFYQPVRFQATGVSGKQYTAGFKLGLEKLGKFSADLYADWNEFELDKTNLVSEMPKWDAGLAVGYRRTDKLTFRLGADWVSARRFNVFYDLDSDAARVTDESATGRLRSAVDISASAELKVRDGFWLWAEGNNLFSQRIHPYPYYRDQGINVLVGIKATF